MTNVAHEHPPRRFHLVETSPPIETQGDRLVVTRLVAGLHLRTALPMAGALGIGIDVQLQGDVTNYVVSLVAGLEDARVLTRLTDEVAARRVWSEVAATTGLPRLVAQVEGGWRALDVRAGALVAEMPQARRVRSRTAPRRPSGQGQGTPGRSPRR